MYSTKKLILLKDRRSQISCTRNFVFGTSEVVDRSFSGFRYSCGHIHKRNTKNPETFALNTMKFQHILRISSITEALCVMLL